MPKMNKQQLDHLNRRLNEKIAAVRAAHPGTRIIQSLQKDQEELSSQQEALRILQRATKTELQALLGEFITDRTYLSPRELLPKVFELPAASKTHAKQIALDKEILALQYILDQRRATLEQKKNRVIDLAVFADSPDAVLEAIESFMKE